MVGIMRLWSERRVFEKGREVLPREAPLERLPLSTTQSHDWSWTADQLVSRAAELVSRANELVPRANELVPRANELRATTSAATRPFEALS
jgi:hypothetical protein